MKAFLVVLGFIAWGRFISWCWCSTIREKAASGRRLSCGGKLYRITEEDL